MDSPFLQRPPSEWVASNDLAFAIRDKYPVTPNHTLVIPKRVVATWFDTTWDERVALLELVDEVRRLLEATAPRPDGYNIGVNVGQAAGQTIMAGPQVEGVAVVASGAVRWANSPRGELGTCRCASRPDGPLQAGTAPSADVQPA